MYSGTMHSGEPSLLGCWPGRVVESLQRTALRTSSGLDETIEHAYHAQA
jgi:hypothetical protein